MVGRFYSEGLGYLFGSVPYGPGNYANYPRMLQNQQGAACCTGTVAFGGSLQEANLLHNIFAGKYASPVSQQRDAVERVKEVLTREVEVE